MKSKQESHLRSILKAISWRIVASLTTFTLAVVVFQSTGCDDVIEKSAVIAVAETVIKLLLYYFHERGWQMIPRGSVRKMMKKGASSEEEEN